MLLTVADWHLLLPVDPTVCTIELFDEHVVKDLSSWGHPCTLPKLPQYTQLAMLKSKLLFNFAEGNHLPPGFRVTVQGLFKAPVPTSCI